MKTVKEKRSYCKKNNKMYDLKTKTFREHLEELGLDVKFNQ